MSTNNQEHFFEKFDAYLDGGLDRIEAAELKKALNEHPELQAALKNHIDARANIRIKGEELQKQKFKAAFQNLENTQPIPPPSNAFKYMKVGLSIVAIIAGLFYAFEAGRDAGKETKVKTEKVMEPMAYLDEASPQLLRSIDGNEMNENWTRAVEAYSKKEYKTAIQYFEKLETVPEFIEQHQGKINLYNGIAHARLKEYSKSIKLLSKIQDDNPYKDQGQWYEALVQLMAGNKAVAKESLAGISTNELHYKNKAAKKLLDSLD